MRIKLFKFLPTVLLALLVVCCGVAYAEPTSTVYSNPLVKGLADPCIMFYNGVFYMSGTGVDNISFDLYTSTDLVSWTKSPKKLYRPGGIDAWAPDLFYNSDDGKFYLYYSVDKQIGVACSDTPDGHYTDLGIIIPDAYDAQMFRDDDGSYYLYYCWNVRAIYVQPMSSPTQPKGKPQMLLQSNQSWENGSENEAPWVFKHDNMYYLIFSSNDARTNRYGEGYAKSKKPTGPFIKYGRNPIIQASNNAYGPGSGCVIADQSGNYWHLYHQKDSPLDGWSRSVCLDKLWFDDRGNIHCQVTKSGAQPGPVTGSSN